MYEIIAVVSSSPFCMTSTRRLAKRRSSRSRTHVEFEVLLGVTARDEMHRKRARAKLLRDGAAAGHEGLRHHLATERPHRIAARVRADERVVVEAVEVQYRQQLLEVCLLLSRKRLSPS